MIGNAQLNNNYEGDSMALQIPNSMDECVYFTNRTIGSGNAKAWAMKMDCPECKKAKMGKPVEKGKVKIRADYYECPECKYREEKKEHEAKLTLSVIYTCPYCLHKGEAETEFKRKSFEGVPSYIFICESCNKKIGVTKKMKEPKKK